MGSEARLADCNEKILHKFSIVIFALFSPSSLRLLNVQRSFKLILGLIRKTVIWLIYYQVAYLDVMT